MKIFISWSGDRSRAVAELLNEWIKCVIQASRPWISTQDIDRGAIWFSEINDQLKDTSAGIVCLTQDNKDKPWILFETGALAKGLSSNRVCTFLIDLRPADLENPLAQFNHTLPQKESMYGLIKTLNTCLGAAGLDETVLKRVFDTYWPQFEERFKSIVEAFPPSTKQQPRPRENVMAEILESTRTMAQQMRYLEARFDKRDMDDAIRGRRMPPSIARKLLTEMLEAGADPETVYSKLRESGVPAEYISRSMDDYISRRSKGNSDLEKL